MRFNNLKLISFVGVDEFTDLSALESLQGSEASLARDECPEALLEFSVLFSRGKKGGRYSTLEFCHSFLEMESTFSKSLHLCGKEAIDQFLDEQEEIMNLASKANRIQLNFAIKKYDEEKLVQGILSAMEKGNHIILQLNKSKAAFVERLLGCVFDKSKLSILHDGSGGFGREIQNVVPPMENHFTGYAGGIKPNNVSRIVEMIEAKNTDNLPYYIDMESGVREENVFSVAKCAEVIAGLLGPKLSLS